MAGYHTDAVKHAERIEKAPPGTLAAFELPDGTVKSGKIVEIDLYNREITLQTAHGTFYDGVLYENVLWVKTGQRWPRWVYNRLKGYSDNSSENSEDEILELEITEPVAESEEETENSEDKEINRDKKSFIKNTLNFAARKMHNKKENEIYEMEKQKYYLSAGEYFERYVDGDEVEFEITTGDDEAQESTVLQYTVKKVKRNKLTFDGEKTFIALRNNKPVRDKAITKTYTINSWLLFSEYMKKLGADVNVIRDLLDIDYKVNLDVLDNESELGNVSLQELAGCYQLETSEPYYTVKMKEKK